MCFPCCSLLLLPFPGPRRFKMRCLPALSSMQLDPAPSRQGTSPPPTPRAPSSPWPLSIKPISIWRAWLWCTRRIQTMPARALVGKRPQKRRRPLPNDKCSPSLLCSSPSARPACFSVSRINLEGCETILISIATEALSANNGTSPQSSCSSRSSLSLVSLCDRQYADARCSLCFAASCCDAMRCDAMTCVRKKLAAGSSCLAAVAEQPSRATQNACARCGVQSSTSFTSFPARRTPAAAASRSSSAVVFIFTGFGTSEHIILIVPCAPRRHRRRLPGNKQLMVSISENDLPSDRSIAPS